MRKKINYCLITAVMLLGLNACAVLNPYESDFMCPDGFAGECAGVKQAYEKSLGNDESFSPMVKNQKTSEGKTEENTVSHERYRYEQAMYKEMAGLIEKPATPMLIPSKQLRVLIPGYVDEKDGIYYGHRHVYFTAKQAQWALQPFEPAQKMEDIQ